MYLGLFLHIRPAEGCLLSHEGDCGYLDVMEIQVTFDADDPRALADFWQEVLDYKRDEPPAGFDTWQEFLEDAGVPEEQWDGADALVPKDRNGPRVFFQKVPESKTAKNRIHLDVRVATHLNGDERMAALEDRAMELIAIGAARLKRFEPDNFTRGHIVLADPEGNEFCLD